MYNDVLLDIDDDVLVFRIIMISIRVFKHIPHKVTKEAKCKNFYMPNVRIFRKNSKCCPQVLGETQIFYLR